jgi:hypothetical protein
MKTINTTTILGNGDISAGTVLGAIFNSSTSSQTINAVDAYVTGCKINIGGKINGGTVIRMRGTVTKTAAGTVAPIFTVRFGTNGNITDTARHTFTCVAQTAATDTGFFEIDVIINTVNVNATTFSVLRFQHFNTTTGLANKAQIQIIQNTSATFDTTLSNLNIGLSINPGASGVWTILGANAEIRNPS